LSSPLLAFGRFDQVEIILGCVLLAFITYLGTTIQQKILPYAVNNRKNKGKKKKETKVLGAYGTNLENSGQDAAYESYRQRKLRRHGQGARHESSKGRYVSGGTNLLLLSFFCLIGFSEAVLVKATAHTTPSNTTYSLSRPAIFLSCHAYRWSSEARQIKLPTAPGSFDIKS